MDTNTQYMLQTINLQHLAITKVAIYLWETPEVKVRLKEFLKTLSIECIDHWQAGALKKWRVLTSIVLKKSEQIFLTSSLKSELAIAVIGIGIEICTWDKYIRSGDLEVLNDPLNCIKPIHWTYYGTINQVDSLKTHFMDNPDLLPEAMYCMAAENMMEESANYAWNKMSLEKQRNCKHRTNFKTSPYLATYWQCYWLNDFSELNNKVLADRYLEDQLDFSMNVKMLYLTTKDGYYEAMKYFWTKLNQSERDRNILELALIVVGSFEAYESHILKHMQYGKICIFLINQMTLNQRSQFVRDHFSDCFRVMFTWPWQEFIMAYMDEGWQYLLSEDNDDNSILNIIVENMYYMNLWGCSMEYNKYRSIFQYVYRNMPNELRGIDVHKKGDLKWVWRLYELWDLPNLKLLFDTMTDSERKQLLEAGSSKFKSLMSKSELEPLKEFRKMILSQEDIDFLKEHFKVYGFGTQKNCPDDKLINWLCDMEE